MTTFTKWFLLNAVMLTAAFLVEQKGWLTLVIKNDASYISIVIMSLYVIISAFVGRLCYLADKMSKDNPEKKAKEESYLNKRADLGWFAAEHFFSLGLLGTLIGLTIATSTSLTEEAQVTQIVTGLKAGLNTAFYTTICGIVFSLPLQVQLMILKQELDQ
jgi:hypothetical protein